MSPKILQELIDYFQNIVEIQHHEDTLEHSFLLELISYQKTLTS